MATYTKPTSIPRWADTGVIVVPSSAKQDSGWVAPELPPDTFFNWHQNLVGQWVKWIDERHDDGGGTEDYSIKALPGAADGGDLSLLGGAPGVITGDGGDVLVTSGAGGGTSGDGGGIIVTAGSAISGQGGNIAAQAGKGVGSSGGVLFLQAGESDTTAGTFRARGGFAESGATDLAGGPAILAGGRATGDQGSNAELHAAVAGGAGTANRNAEVFLTADGALGQITTTKKLVIAPSAADDALVVQAFGDNAAIIAMPPAASGAVSYLLDADWTGNPADMFRLVHDDVIFALDNTGATDAAIRIISDSFATAALGTGIIGDFHATNLDSTSTGTGIQVQHLGTGSGVCYDGAISGSGIGYNMFLGAASSGEGVNVSASSTSTAKGIVIDVWSTTQGAPLHIEPQTGVPGIANIVGDLYMETGGVLKVCTVAGTPGTWVSVGAQT